MRTPLGTGANEVHPIVDEHGWRLGRIEHPFGHHWEIGKPLVPWPPADGQPHDSIQNLSDGAATVARFAQCLVPPI